MPNFFTTHEVAELFGTQTWKVRRLFEDHELPEPGRFAGKRAIPRESLPAIVEALQVAAGSTSTRRTADDLRPAQLPKLFAETPIPAGPISPEAAEAVAQLLWEAAESDEEQRAGNNGQKRGSDAL